MNKCASPNANRVSRVCLVLAGAWFLMPSNAAAAAFNFQTINNNADLTFNQLLGINNAGNIGGYFGDGATNPNKGYTVVPPYGQGNFTNENFPGSVQTQVVGINNSGITVGFWADALANANNFGFVDNAGTFTSVQNPSTPAVGTKTNQLLGVNDHNVAAGFYNDAGGASHAYLYNIGTLAFSSITVPGATSATATGINNNGVVSGFYTAASGDVLGFIDIGGVFKTFEAPGSTSTMFFGLNNNDQAVGSFVDSTGNTEGLLYNFDSGLLQPVNDPNAVGPGGTIINGINDRGQMVGFYVDAAGNTDGLLASTPEPASLGLMLLGGLGALLFSARLRRKV